MKRGEHNFSGDSSQPISYADIMESLELIGEKKLSYKESVLGGRDEDYDLSNKDSESEESDEDEDSDSNNGMRV